MIKDFYIERIALGRVKKKQTNGFGQGKIQTVIIVNSFAACSVAWDISTPMSALHRPLNSENLRGRLLFTLIKCT